MSDNNGTSTQSAKEAVDLSKTTAVVPVATQVAPVTNPTPAPMPAPTPAQQARDFSVNVNPTFTININLPPQVVGYQAPSSAPTPVVHDQDRPFLWVFAIAAALATLALLAMAFGQNRVVGPITVPSAPIVRTSGTVDIGLVAIGDQGIDWFNPVAPGVYPLRQTSTGMFIVENGTNVLVNGSGIKVFR